MSVARRARVTSDGSVILGLVLGWLVGGAGVRLESSVGESVERHVGGGVVAVAARRGDSLMVGGSCAGERGVRIGDHGGSGVTAGAGGRGRVSSRGVITSRWWSLTWHRPTRCGGRRSCAGGVRALFAYPLHIGAIGIGVLALYRDRPAGLRASGRDVDLPMDPLGRELGPVLAPATTYRRVERRSPAPTTDTAGLLKLIKTLAHHPHRDSAVPGAVCSRVVPVAQCVEYNLGRYVIVAVVARR
jgi:hypothetical protein